MATRFTNFGSGTVGEAPSGFTETIATTLAAWTVESVAGATGGGKVLRVAYSPDGGGDARAGLVWTDAPASDIDGSEVVTKMRVVSGPSVMWFGPAVDAVVRARGGDDANDGVRGEYHRNDTKVYAKGYNASTANFSFTPGTSWFWVRVRRVGRYAWVRAWLDGDDEPTAWNIISLDLGVADAATHVSGRPAFFIEASPTTAVVEFDQIGWATDGDTAPREYILVPGRMRGLTNLKREVLGSPRYGVYPRFIMRDGAGDDIDYSAWFVRASWGLSIDQPILTATVELAREAAGESLAPLVEGSARNTDGLGGYAPALYPARYCALYVAITEDGAAPEEWEYLLVWEGRSDEIDWSGRGAISITCRDLGGWLAETQIEDERTYPTLANPLATLLQSILDDNPAHPTDPVPVLQVDGDPDWFKDGFTQQQTRLMPALTALADAIGWELRYDYLSEAYPFALVLREPRRDVVDPDTTWGPSEYKQVPVARINDEGVRNRLRIIRKDVAGVLQSVLYTNTVSAGIFGNRFMQFGGDPIVAIDTETESDRLADTALADLATPEFDHAYRFRFNPWVMLGDFYAFSANAVHYDVEETGAVVSVQHELTAGGGSTTIQTAGKPRSAYRRWLAKAERRFPPELLSYSLAQVGSNGVLGDIVVSEPTTELRVWARNGDTPLVGGVPDNRYLIATRKPEALAAGITWPVADGTWQIVMQAYAGEDRFTRVTDDLVVSGLGGGSTGGGSGGPATAPSVAPPTPSIAAGLVSGSNQDAEITWINTDSADDIEVEWYSWGDTFSTDTRPAGTVTAQETFDVTDPNRVKARIRYTNVHGDGPWSGFSRVIELRG